MFAVRTMASGMIGLAILAEIPCRGIGTITIPAILRLRARQFLNIDLYQCASLRMTKGEGFGEIEILEDFQERQTQDPSLLFGRWKKRGLIYGDSG
jgi:hypothetical protein